MARITYCTLLNLQNESRKLVTTEQEFLHLKSKEEKTTNQIKFLWQCGCGEFYWRNISTINKNKNSVCKNCTTKIKSEKKKIKEVEYVRILKTKGLELVGELPNNTETKFCVKCECGNTFFTTYASLKNTNAKDGKQKCRVCRGSENSKNYMKPFSEILKRGNEICVKIITTEDEYNGAYTTLRVIGKCGHETTMSCRTLFRDGHYMCNECTIKMTSGENNYNWKGGYDNERNRFRKTYEYKQWVKDVYRRDNYTCQCCVQKSKKLNAHHIDGYNWCVDKRIDVNNGVTLCEYCHNEFHTMYGRGNNTTNQWKLFIEYKKNLFF